MGGPELYCGQAGAVYGWAVLYCGWVGAVMLRNYFPILAAVALRKKVVSIGQFSPNFCFQSLQIFLFVRSNQEQFYVLSALKIREKIRLSQTS